MKASSFLSVLGLGTAVYAQTSEFETPDFNITEALIANGINVSALPELAPLVERSLLSGCSIAVSLHLSRDTCFNFANIPRSVTL